MHFSPQFCHIKQNHLLCAIKYKIIVVFLEIQEMCLSVFFTLYCKSVIFLFYATFADASPLKALITQQDNSTMNY